MKALEVILQIFGVVVVLALICLCAAMGVSRKIIQVPETNLIIVECTSVFYETDGVTSSGSYYLMNGTDTVSFCHGYNPYVNARGLVYIPKKGVCDCRSGEIKLIMPLGKIGGIKIDAVGEDRVSIAAGDPDWDWHEMQWDYSEVAHYMYNLDTGTLSSVK